jgi:CubicO group peptidase (beta-lactamase class C family)
VGSELLSVPMPPLPPQAENVPWPTESWPEAEPGDDVDRETLARVYRTLFEDADSDRTGETHALLVVHRGRLVAEQYGQGRSQDQKLVSWSMAKSITQALLGMLVRDGKLDLRAPAPVPRWHETRADPRAAITTLHLLGMADGLDFVEVYLPDGISHVIEMLFQGGKEDVAGFAESRALKHPPGTYWSYSSGTTNILAAIAGRIVGGGEAGMRAFLEGELFAPLGMKGVEPRFDPAGTFIGSSYVFTTARNFARFGLLYLRDGVWEGRRLLPAGWVDLARGLSIPSFDKYGHHWWLARDGSGRFHASGYRGQYIVVDPARDLVVVRLGATDEEKRPRVKHLLAEAVRAFPLV